MQHANDIIIQYKKLPKYIITFFHDKYKLIDAHKNNKHMISDILQSINTKETFIQELDKYLENDLNKFLGIKIEAEEEQVYDF